MSALPGPGDCDNALDSTTEPIRVRSRSGGRWQHRNLSNTIMHVVAYESMTPKCEWKRGKPKVESPGHQVQWQSVAFKSAVSVNGETWCIRLNHQADSGSGTRR